MTLKMGGKSKKFGKLFSGELNFSILFVSTLVIMHDDPLPNVCLPEVIHCSHVSWWAFGSCERFVLCMSSFIYVFVVFLCRPVDDVAFVYL